MQYNTATDETVLRNRKIRKIAMLLLGSILLIVLFAWLSSHSFIHVRVASPIGEDIHYSLTDQNTGKNVEFNSKSPNVSKLVKKGSYEVLATRGETSSFALAEAKSFLRKTTVSANLRPEKSRAFVGNNPSTCMYYGLGQLFSYACDGNYESLAAHMPANASTPTLINTPINAPPNTPLGGLVSLRGKDFFLLNNVVGGESNEEPYRLYDLTPDLRLLHYIALPGVNAGVSYKVSGYRDGFLLYSSTYEDILDFATAASAPQKINIAKPNEKDIFGQQLSVEGSRIAVAYATENKELEPKKKGSAGGQTVVQVYEGGQTKSFSLAGTFNFVQLCAGTYLCAIQGNQLNIYDIGGNAAKFLSRIGNVNSVLSSGGKVLAVRNDGVLEFDVASRSGFMQYSMGPYAQPRGFEQNNVKTYAPCGAQTVSTGGYVLCVASPKGDKSALFIDPLRDNADSIDKKVLLFSGAPILSAVSAYGSYIYLVPDLGAPVYTPGKGYGPDPKIKEKAAADIRALIQEAGIDQSVYKVINTTP